MKWGHWPVGRRSEMSYYGCDLLKTIPLKKQPQVRQYHGDVCDGYTRGPGAKRLFSNMG